MYFILNLKTNDHMSIKNLFIILCLLTSSFNQANAVHSSIESTYTSENNLQKRTLKERLLEGWVARKLKKLDNSNITLPPDLTKCLNINLKNRQVHKGYQVQISDNLIAYKKCNSDSDEIREVKLDEIESITSTDGNEVYFKQTIYKTETEVTLKDVTIHPAVTLGLVLTLVGLGTALWIQLLFGMIMIATGVLLAFAARKILRRSKNWKGKSLISVITGLGAGALIMFLSLTERFK